MAALAMRFSPTKTNILLKKNPVTGGTSDKHGYQTVESAGEIASKQLGIAVGASNEKMLTDGDDILVDDWGRPLVDREIAFLPDPRYREGAHLIFCLLWYGGCIAAILYIAFVFMVYQPEQFQSIPFTGSLSPKATLRLRLSCSAPTVAVVRVNYSDPQSKCFNESAVLVGDSKTDDHHHDHDHDHYHHNRRFNTLNHHLPAAFTPQPPPVQWLKGGPEVPSPISDISEYKAGEYMATHTETMDLPLCYHGDTIYDTNWYWPEFPGVALMFGNISSENLCVVDVFSTFDGASEVTPLRRLSVEGSVIKTFFVQYKETRLKHEEGRLHQEELRSHFYELDGMRTFAGGDTSIIRFRFTDVSLSVLEFDMRSWVVAGGIFGSLWYLISNYSCFYAAPVLLCLFPRNFIEDAKNGKLDGYTLNGLAHCWRPTVWLWIGGELVKRIKFAAGGSDKL